MYMYTLHVHVHQERIKAYHNMVLNGKRSLKVLHLYGNLAIVVTTSNQAKCRQACRARACLSALCYYMYSIHEQ